MSEMIDTAAAVRLLQGMEDVAILCHKSPDGDTLGCGFALLYALQRLGKRAVVLCKDPLPDRYAYLGEGTHTEPPFVPKAVVAVDTASDALLGEPLQLYADRVDLCIDHHPSNTGYAKRLLLRPTAAAACELMTDLLTELSGLDERMADCLYTGLVTDTGCFKHPSVTVDTHRIAQQLLLAGAQMQKIHRMYDSMTKGKAALTAYVLEHLRYELDGRCALVVLPRDVINLHQVTDDQLEGISSLPRQIEGVLVGVTLRQYKSCKGYKLSVRTDGIIDASAICARLGGGGHRGAAGCNVEDTPVEQVYQQILHSVQQQLDAQG